MKGNEKLETNLVVKYGYEIISKAPATRMENMLPPLKNMKNSVLVKNFQSGLKQIK